MFLSYICISTSDMLESLYPCRDKDMWNMTRVTVNSEHFEGDMVDNFDQLHRTSKPEFHRSVPKVRMVIYQNGTWGEFSWHDTKEVIGHLLDIMGHIHRNSSFCSHTSSKFGGRGFDPAPQGLRGQVLWGCSNRRATPVPRNYSLLQGNCCMWLKKKLFSW